MNVSYTSEGVMSLILDENSANYQIRGYQPGQIQINDKIYTHSLILSPTQLIESWGPATVQDLSLQYLETAAALQPAVLIIGTGDKLIFPPLEIYGELINRGIGVEIMDTRAACRTYQVLTAENRQIVAALLL